MNHFQKFNKAKRNFFLQKMLDFSSVYFGVKDWRKSNMIRDALYIHILFVNVLTAYGCT